MVIAWLPADADHAALGPLPASVRLRPWGEGPGQVEFLVLDPRQRAQLAEAVPSLSRLRVVQTLNAGVDWVPPLPDGVALCNASGVHDGPVAEWVFAVVLADAKRLRHFWAEQQAGRWDGSANLAFADGVAARDLAETTVLVVGHGSIGRAVEARLAALGTRVLRVARRRRAGVADPSALPALLPQADVVVLLVPASPETRHLVDAAFLAAMRDGALLVNAARGSLVDTGALLAEVRSGRLRAVLDATEPEPLPAGHPLWSAPGVVVTPHVAGSSAHWWRRAYALAGDQLRAYAAGEPLRNVQSGRVPIAT